MSTAMSTGLTIIADENIPKVQEFFASIGNVICVDGRSLHRAQVKDADILLVRSVTAVNQQLLTGSRVRFVATATIGVDHLDTQYLDQQRIGWASAPGCNAESVVDYVMSALCRLRAVLEALANGARVGIIGMGNVGSRLYRRLDKLGIDCIGYDPLIPQDRFPNLRSLSEVLACHVLCCHTPLTSDGPHATHHMINAQVLSQLKEGTVLINAGRGGAVDNQALLDTLSARDDLSVVLDVWEQEPAVNAQLLAKVTLGTAHIAGYSLDGKLAGTQKIYEACCRYLGISIASSGPFNGDKTVLQLSRNQPMVELIREAVLRCYDIAEDDQRLREAYSSAHDSQSRGKAFDLLRKHYPIRREFSRFCVGNVQILDTKQREALRAVGFDTGTT